MSYYSIQGVFHGPPEPTGAFRGTRINEEEAERTLRQFVGKPLLYGHNKARKVGEIRGIERHPNGDIYADGVIDRATLYGPRVIREIEAGEMRGLSWGVAYPGTENSYRFSDLVPEEISIVERGGVDRARIVRYGPGITNQVSTSALREIHSRPTVPRPITKPGAKPNYATLEEFVSLSKKLGGSARPGNELMCQRVMASAVQNWQDADRKYRREKDMLESALVERSLHTQTRAVIHKCFSLT